MTLLTRNRVVPSGALVAEVSAESVEVAHTSPLSPDYPVPEWVSTPWSLVDFYFQQLSRRYGRQGRPWLPPLGSDHKPYLRAAKTILTLGPGTAVRLVVFALGIAKHPPSLWWVSEQADNFLEKRCEMPTGTEIPLIELM